MRRHKRDGCQHPPSRLYAWHARDDVAPNGRVLVVCCLECHTVLRGSAEDSPGKKEFDRVRAAS